ncbi:MAG: ATP-binding cassette domain-containing protein [Telmatospirillum sp.]|nr:ATP-binding cassette domain-containing protein [Telmatospirillum sp.]
MRLRGVTHQFGSRRVLSGVDLTLAAGEGVRLVGPSGRGKSTLLEIAAGLLAPTRGTVDRRGRLAIAFQDDALLPWTDAAGNLAYALAGIPGGRQRIAPWLERFGLPPDLLPGAMSGGMCRRLALARAFAAGADLTILDEPFAFPAAGGRAAGARPTPHRAAAGGAVLHSTHQTEDTPASTSRTLAIDDSGGLAGL